MKEVLGSALKGARELFGQTLVRLGQENDHLVVIDCETSVPTNVEPFRQAFPDRFVQMGIAEQNAVSFAYGVAASGLIPVVPLFAAFLSRRAYDQVFVQIGYSHANVKMVGCYAGITSPNTGATHQSLLDIAVLRSIPGITVIEPADVLELEHALRWMIEHEGPVYLRMPRGDIEPYETQRFTGTGPFIPGRATVLRSGSDVTLIGSGIMVARCMEAASRLAERGVSAEVINLSSIKPLDAETLVASARKTRRVVTAENHSTIGGVGSAVTELLSEVFPVPISRIGVRDDYGESGALPDLLKKTGLTSDAVVAAAEALASS